MDSLSSSVSGGSVPGGSVPGSPVGSDISSQSSSFGSAGSARPASVAPHLTGGSPAAPAGSPAASRSSSAGGSVSSVAPAGTPGLRPSSASQPAPDPVLDNMNFPQLSQEGDKRLAAAKEAYTRYGTINIAQQAKEALGSFIDACTANSGSRADMIAALMAIQLPSSAPTDLSVTIQYPGQPSKSLIPPERKQLEDLSRDDIIKCYRMANQAMDNWSRENAQSANALATAQQQLNDAVDALKAVREAIDKKTREMTNRPGSSQLEVQYQEFVDKGVSIHSVSTAEQVEVSGVPGNPSPQP